MSPELTKLRLQMERAQRAFDEARQTKEAAELAFNKQARVESVCPSCLQPEKDGSHFGTCYVTVAQGCTCNDDEDAGGNRFKDWDEDCPVHGRGVP